MNEYISFGFCLPSTWQLQVDEKSGVEKLVGEGGEFELSQASRVVRRILRTYHHVDDQFYLQNTRG